MQHGIKYVGGGNLQVSIEENAQGRVFARGITTGTTHAWFDRDNPNSWWYRNGHRGALTAAIEAASPGYVARGA